MAQPVKFTFDQAFDGGAKSRYDVQLERLQKENVTAKEEMRNQGFVEGREKALAEIEAATQVAMETISQSAEALFAQHNQLREELKQDMVQLAYAIASKLSPALIRQHPLEEISALIEDCMTTAHREPRLVVRVAESMAEPISARIDAMKHTTGFSGDIVLIGETNLAQQDCRVEWPDGGSERSMADIQREIENAVQRFVIPDTAKTDEPIENDTELL
ncbi:FliH/SctL family protein [Kordiimonas pumila]|uniref:FliH/SctL family protein n=1 Tax=Kordiimonas pumila TaxID=2161677 RepID=A0ABV7D7J5_9PROT|nr:FliH/SctL family protein [Kordiimonas pumila]